MPPGRLLAVVAVDRPGAPETSLLLLLGALRRRGWRTGVTTPAPGPLRDAALDAGHTWQPLVLGGLAPFTGARAALSWPRARRLARDADVMYLGGTVAGRLLPGLRGARTRTVLHVHDMLDTVPRVWRGADLVLADSHAVADRLAPLDVHVVHPPVDPDPPAIEAPWEPGGGSLVGFVGRIEPRRGPLDLARAASAIRAGAPGARVLVVGDGMGDASYREAVAGVPGVEVHELDRSPGAGLLRHLDVLVLPSYQEASATLLAQAMAVGTPVVASRVDGVPEVVDEGVTGALAEAGSPDEIAAAVLRVLGNHDALSVAARRRAGRFHLEAHADLVERLISRPPAPAGAHRTAPARESVAR